MKKLFFTGLLAGVYVFGVTSLSSAVTIDFHGGTAFLADDSSVTTTNTGLWSNVDYYIEDGMKIDFVGGFQTIGDYYNDSPSGGIGGYGDSVLHSHLDNNMSINFSSIDGSAFNLNFIDITSDTQHGGGYATGMEETRATNNRQQFQMLSPSDWGIDYTFYGEPADGVIRNSFDPKFFNNIISFTISSDNAYCIGIDNFNITPASVPEPSSMLLFGTCLTCLVGSGRIRKRKK